MSRVVTDPKLSDKILRAAEKRLAKRVYRYARRAEGPGLPRFAGSDLSN